MQPGMLKRYGASILAFGHLSGMQHLHRRHRPRAVAKPITKTEPSMNAADMNITFESDPMLYRAIHPIFDGRQSTQPEPTVSEYQHNHTAPLLPIANSKPAATWTWEV